MPEFTEFPIPRLDVASASSAQKTAILTALGAAAAADLSNVDNTSDANKPVSTAQQTAIDTEASTRLAADNRRAFAGAVYFDATQGYNFSAPLLRSKESWSISMTIIREGGFAFLTDSNSPKLYLTRQGTGTLSFRLQDGSVTLNATNPKTTPLQNGVIYNALLVHDGANEESILYIDGEPGTPVDTSTLSDFAFGTDWGVFQIGNTSSGAIKGSLGPWGIFNRALSATEVAELSDIGIEAWLAKYPQDQWGDSTALTSGTLEVGQRYRISTFVAGDDFTNVGAASNATGVEFVATGTTPTTWTNASSILPIGAFAAYPMTEGNGRQLRDLSGRYDALLSATGYQHLKPKTEGYVRVKGFDASAAGSYMLEASDIIPANSVVTKLVSENRFVDLTNAEQDLADRRIELDASGANLNINRSDGTTDQTLGTVTTPTSASDIDAQIHYEQVI